MPTVGAGTGTAEVATHRPFSTSGPGVQGGAAFYSGPTPPANSMSLISDNFNDNTIGPLWPMSYGNVSESGGRAVMQCDTGYSAYQTARIYRFDSILARVFAPASNGATGSSYAEMGVYSAGQPAGTDVVLYLDITVGLIYPAIRTGYYDPTSTGVAYNATTMAWWRIRISGGDIVWEVSPDGSTWTPLRTAAAPAYLLTADDVCVLFDTHREAGTNSTYEVDNFNLPPTGSTPVSSTVDLRWSVLSTVAQSVDLRWSVTSAVSADLSVNWAVLSSVTGTTDLRWGVLSAVAATSDLRWNVLNSVSASTDLRWSQYQTASNGTELVWQVKNSVSQAADLRWQQRQSVTSSVDLRWTSSASVSNSVDLRWQQRQTVSNSVDLRWTVSAAASASVDLRWQVRQAVQQSLDLRWVSRAGVEALLDLRYAVMNETDNLFGEIDPAIPDAGENTRYVLGTRFTVNEDGYLTEGSWFFPLTHPTPSGGSPQNVIIGLFRVSDQVELARASFAPGTVTLGARNWRAWVGGPVAVVAGDELMVAVFTVNQYVATVSYPWPVTSSGGALTASTPNGWLVTNPTDLTYPTTASGNSANYFPDVTWSLVPAKTQVTQTVDLRWQVRSAASASLDLQWQVRTSIANAVDLRYAVLNAIASPVDLRWAVQSAVSVALDLRWAVLSSVSAPLDLRWTQRAQVSNAVDLQWSSAGGVASVVELRWAVRNAVAGTLDLRWAVTVQISAVLGLIWIVRSRASNSVQLLWDVEGVPDVVRSEVRAQLTQRIKSHPQLTGSTKADLRWRSRFSSPT